MKDLSTLFYLPLFLIAWFIKNLFVPMAFIVGVVYIYMRFKDGQNAMAKYVFYFTENQEGGLEAKTEVRYFCAPDTQTIQASVSAYSSQYYPDGSYYGVCLDTPENEAEFFSKYSLPIELDEFSSSPVGLK